MCDSLDYHFVVCLLGPCAFASLYRYKMAIFPDLVIIALGSVVNLFIFITSYYAGFRFLGLIYMTTLVHWYWYLSHIISSKQVNVDTKTIKNG
jgi:hypothetical protein